MGSGKYIEDGLREKQKSAKLERLEAIWNHELTKEMNK